MRKPLDICFWLGIAIAGAGGVWAFRPTPDMDSDYFARVRNTAFRRGPSVLFDEAHWNAVTAHGMYEPFVKLIRRDGYRVYRNKQEFVPELLASYDNLVIVDPLGFRGEPFTPDEVKAVNDWVRGGGNLLLAVSAGEAAVASRALAQSFGVKTTGRAIGNSEPSIADHAISRGRRDFEEDLRRLAFFGGQTLAGPAPFLGNQAIAMAYEKGRVVIIGDPLALTARRVNGERRGINNTDFDNHQLVLNIMHWLSRLI